MSERTTPRPRAPSTGAERAGRLPVAGARLCILRPVAEVPARPASECRARRRVQPAAASPTILADEPPAEASKPRSSGSDPAMESHSVRAGPPEPVLRGACRRNAESAEEPVDGEASAFLNGAAAARAGPWTGNAKRGGWRRKVTQGELRSARKVLMLVCESHSGRARVGASAMTAP